MDGLLYKEPSCSNAIFTLIEEDTAHTLFNISIILVHNYAIKGLITSIFQMYAVNTNLIFINKIYIPLSWLTLITLKGAYNSAIKLVTHSQMEVI